MSDSTLTAWQCPACTRRIPRNVEVCRCGTERRRLEELGFSFETIPPPTEASSKQRPGAHPAATTGPLGLLLGFRYDTHLNAGLRGTLKALFVVSVIGVGVLTARMAYAPPHPVRGNVQILTTLEEFTLKAGATGNTIPAFLSAAGTAGALAPAGTDNDPVRAVNETDLGRGFCSPSIAGLIRHEYPGYYDRWTDDRLETVALEKHPEYTNRLCTISTRLDASPKEIVKYRLLPRTLLGHIWAVSETLLAMILFAFAGVNVYYRLIVGRLTTVD